MLDLLTCRHRMLCACLMLVAGCEHKPCTASHDLAHDKPEPNKATANQASPSCQPVCNGSACNGCDPKDEHCDKGIVTGQFGVRRWPDPNIGPNRLDAAIHRTTACGGVKWPFATTNYVCGTFSTWLADADGNELPSTRYDSVTETVQIYGNMWSGAARACASVCGQSICSPLDM